jgi:ABC-type dipeptide/oligopeptide/nickel transport system permease component
MASPMVLFIIRRLLAIPITLFIVTMVLYAIACLTPPQVRAEIYMPSTNRQLTAEQRQRLIQNIINERGLDQPFPIQYARWLGTLLQGDWGWSPTMRTDILPALLYRTPVTVELTLYSLLLYLPLGLFFGVIASWQKGNSIDNNLRLSAFIATSIPPFILALVLLSIFYVGLRWFPPDRLSPRLSLEVQREGFSQITGLVSIDSLLNGRMDIFVDSLRHLVLPVFTLSLYHWATTMRVMRISMLETLDTEYMTAAKARGIRLKSQLWKHGFRNAMIPALTSSILSAASLVTGVYVVERIFTFPGISEIITRAIQIDGSDIVSSLAFAIYSTLIVLPLMTGMEIVQAIIDPRIREGVAAE